MRYNNPPRPYPQGEGDLKIVSSNNNINKTNFKKPPLEGKVWRGSLLLIINKYLRLTPHAAKSYFETPPLEGEVGRGA